MRKVRKMVVGDRIESLSIDSRIRGKEGERERG